MKYYKNFFFVNYDGIKISQIPCLDINFSWILWNINIQIFQCCPVLDLKYFKFIIYKEIIFWPVYSIYIYWNNITCDVYIETINK